MGQSRAEPANGREGVETMHPKPNSTQVVKVKRESDPQGNLRKSRMEERGVVSSILTFGTITSKNVKAIMPNDKISISYDQFQQLDFRIGTILTAESLENSNKLLKLIVDIGEEKRTILAGISKSYPGLNDLIGQQALFLVNLEPKEIAGVTSQGMLLAASLEDKAVILSPSEPITPGTKVK